MPMSNPSTVGNHAISVNTGNGHGSINNKIRLMTTTKYAVGSALSVTHSATLGTYITVNQAGFYVADYTDGSTGVAASFGMSVNSAQLTTISTSINIADLIAYARAGTGNVYMTASTSIYLNAGDILRPHTDGACDTTGDRTCSLTVRKVG